MSDDFMEEEFERDRSEAFRLRELVEARCPWDVVKRHFPDLDRVELVVSVNEYDGGRLSRWLEIYQSKASGFVVHSAARICQIPFLHLASNSVCNCFSKKIKDIWSYKIQNNCGN